MVDSDSGLYTPFFTRIVFVGFYTHRFCKVPRFVLRDLNETSLITPTEETRVPLMATYTEDDGGELPFFSEGITLSEKGILVTAFGPNTDGEGDLLRLWEQAGKKGKCTVTLSGKSYRSAQFCNLRGEPLGDSFPIKNNELSVEMHAYQPVSIILKR